MDIPKETSVNPKIEIRETLHKGKGMFAVLPIHEGERILVWGGHYVSEYEAQKARKDGKLVMQWNENLFSVEEVGQDDGYFINHSCDSNTWMTDAFTLTARRDIQVEEEVTADYALWETDEQYISEWACKCESPVCRKKVTGKDWRSPDVQKRYRDHFSPYINKKIKGL